MNTAWRVGKRPDCGTASSFFKTDSLAIEKQYENIPAMFEIKLVSPPLTTENRAWSQALKVWNHKNRMAKLESQ